MINQIAERNLHKEVRLYVGESPLLSVQWEYGGAVSQTFVVESQDVAESVAGLVEQAAIPMSLIYVEGSASS